MIDDWLGLAIVILAFFVGIALVMLAAAVLDKESKE